MIYEKALSLPAMRRRRVRRELSLFGERSGAIRAEGLHFRADGESLVCAEGAEELSDFPKGALLYTAHGHGNAVFLWQDALSPLAGGDPVSLPGPPSEVLAFLPEEGEIAYYALEKSGLYRLSDGVAAEGCNGGTCGCVHYERIFVAEGCRVSWSAPLLPETWTEKGARSVVLPSEGGEILSMVSFRDKLYLFRERGISCLAAYGDPLAFRATPVAYSCGGIVGGSVRVCGEKVLFCTESGLYAFDGTSCNRFSGCAAVELSLPAKTAVADGKYYAAVRAMGENCLWCVDPDEKTGHLIRAQAEELAGGKELYYAERGKLCRLTPCGLPENGRRECVLTTERSLLGLSGGTKYLDGVTVEGAGRFRVEGYSDMGAPRAVYGEAGSHLRFPRPLKGNSFSFHVRTLSPRARISALTFEIREETGQW